ncbi:MAG: Hpt domain-containing protein [Candidatus Omnitrophica bacterium]|nr:Hpt domain-containing protein [Candidatus Omnitrophota bacterium]
MIIIIFLGACVLTAVVVAFLLLRQDSEANIEISRLKLQLGMVDGNPAEIKKSLERMKADSDKLQSDFSQAKEEIIRKDNDLQSRASEAEGLKRKLQEKESEFATKDQEIAKLKSQLAVMEEDHKNSAQTAQEIALKESEIRGLTAEVLRLKGEVEHLSQLPKEDPASKEEIASLKARLATLEQESKSEIERLNSEIARISQIPKEDPASKEEIASLKAQLVTMEQENKNLSAVSKELAGKEDEIKRLSDEIERLTAEGERMKHLKVSEVEMNHIEKLMDEEKKALHAIKMRLQEGKMKLELLDEKTKGAVEAIAQFAQGKEFEEFRKSIHMDQLIQKYENQIKDLQIKIFELEKNPSNLTGGGINPPPSKEDVREGVSMGQEKTGNSFDEMIQQNSKALQLPVLIYLRIASSAIKEAEADIANLEKAIAGNDFTSIDQASHQIKGVFANLRLTVISEPATDINNWARQQANIDQMKEALTGLKTAYEKLKVEFADKS